MKKTTLAAVTALAILATGCTGVKEGWNRHWDDKPKTVVQYSGGKEVGRWTSLGKVQSEASSDGWYFIDKETSKQVMVTGDIQIVDNEN